MSSQIFRCKQFTIHQKKAAFKVGTDGMLLGSWASHDQPQRILDIGTGTGLIALMLAQRYPSAIVEAVDIDKDSAEQAAFNIYNSPWPRRMFVSHIPIQQYESHLPGKHDLIVCNPPFFQNSLPSKRLRLRRARHTDSLSFEDLVSVTSDLLSENGVFCLILPAHNHMQFVSLADGVELSLANRVWIRPKSNRTPNRVLLKFRNHPATLIESKLTIWQSEKVYSDQYKNLTRDFYLSH